MVDPISAATAAAAAAQEMVKSATSGIAAIYEARRKRRMDAAEREGLIEGAKAQVLADIIKARGDGVLAEIHAEAEARRTLLQFERELNISQVMAIADEHAETGKATRSVDGDWFKAFIEGCQDIGKEDMQELWGRLLARQRTNPESFSLRTVACLKTMEAAEAACFESVIPFIWYFGQYFTGANGDKYAAEKGVSYSTWLTLEAIGLVSLNLSTSYRNSPCDVRFGRNMYRFTSERPPMVIQSIKLTETGQQLRRLCDVMPDYDYVEALKMDFVSEGRILLSGPL